MLARRRLLTESASRSDPRPPHICSVYEVGEAAGRHFIAMQYVDGETLEAPIGRAPLDLQEVLAIAVQVVDALGEAHGRGILRRDIKPANIKITARRDVKVMDFGLVRRRVHGGRSGDDALRSGGGARPVPARRVVRPVD